MIMVIQNVAAGFLLGVAASVFVCWIVYLEVQRRLVECWGSTLDSIHKNHLETIRVIQSELVAEYRRVCDEIKSDYEAIAPKSADEDD